MSEVSRREFLLLSALAGMSAGFGRLPSSQDEFAVRTGILDASELTAKVLREIRSFHVTAVSQSAANNWFESDPVIQQVPARAKVYADASEMIREHDLDLLVVSTPSDAVLQRNLHVVAERVTDPEVWSRASVARRCILASALRIRKR